MWRKNTIDVANTVTSVVTGSAKMLPNDSFLFILCLSTVIGLNLGGYRRRVRDEKCDD